MRAPLNREGINQTRDKAQRLRLGHAGVEGRESRECDAEMPENLEKGVPEKVLPVSDSPLEELHSIGLPKRLTVVPFLTDRTMSHPRPRTKHSRLPCKSLPHSRVPLHTIFWECD